MESIVNIKTVFVEESNRSFEKLASFYDNPIGLKQLICELTGEWLTGQLIHGKRVLLKPNWVKHSYLQFDDLCLRTHDQFILAVLEIILEFKPDSVVIGDAPIQGCNWDIMLTTGFKQKVAEMASVSEIPITIKDFRRVTYNPLTNNRVKELNPIEDYLIFDIGKDSFLEPISRSDRNPFRVTYYNPDKLRETHRPGSHKYCISKELFNADVVISLPKIKTHQKAGITGALKNIVGFNGDKDYLPHHRIGGTGFGGDCYPGKNYLRYFSELASDSANRRLGNWQYWPLKKFSGLLWKLSLPGQEHNSGAGWYGNDTVWRMVLDLNRIVTFGTKDGKLSSTPQRVLFSISDGIIGGQGNGPLSPDPLALGIVSFTNHSWMHDVCMSKLMGFDPMKIPLLKEALLISKSDHVKILFNGKVLGLNELEKFRVHAKPPPGWTRFLFDNI